ncbi:hypothetical protein N7523_005735 [Penicillium sp. IBT 18751x]|nr:hypothetical protein N7523_005672 [Penicillium sp. IBT 18751x]KAJ6117984.1 hypothetical protein N7523_005735 [Penicillium sp. IBT 18751x]
MLFSIARHHTVLAAVRAGLCLSPEAIIILLRSYLIAYTDMRYLQHDPAACTAPLGGWFFWTRFPHQKRPFWSIQLITDPTTGSTISNL